MLRLDSKQSVWGGNPFVYFLLNEEHSLWRFRPFNVFTVLICLLIRKDFLKKGHTVIRHSFKNILITGFHNGLFKRLDLFTRSCFSHTIQCSFNTLNILWRVSSVTQCKSWIGTWFTGVIFFLLSILLFSFFRLFGSLFIREPCSFEDRPSLCVVMWGLNSVWETIRQGGVKFYWLLR